jgi:hypothetical protein
LRIRGKAPGMEATSRHGPSELPAMIVSQQFPILLGPHAASPHDFRAINVAKVVHSRPSSRSRLCVVLLA